MTERSSRHLARSATSLRVGPSRLDWQDGTLTVVIDEVTAPWPSRLRGTVRLTPAAVHDTSYALDAGERHHWQPIAPCARVEVDLGQPPSRWQGSGYLDSNRGSAPLEADFARWHWSRARAASGRTTVLYDIARRDGSELALALGFAPDEGDAEVVKPPPVQTLPRSVWRIARATRSAAGDRVEVAATLEDGPFYARSMLRSRLDSVDVTSVHESLDLDRFASPWVQAMLPFRMPRRS